MRIEVISETEVNVFEQATILGFIDYGSYTKTTYAHDGWEWRNTITGGKANFDMWLTIEDAVDRWKFLESRKTT